MDTNRALVIALVALVAASLAGSAVAGAQESVVTLTVSVTTPEGDNVGGAAVTAAWDGGSTTRTTVSNGRVFVDVPEDDDVELTVEHDDYVRNFPLVVEDASEREVDMTVYEKASIEITVEDTDGPVENADVVFAKDREEVNRVSTDADGTADSGTIESGTYDVTVLEAGYYVSTESVDASGATDLAIQIRRGTVTLEVNVTDDHFDPPRPLAEVTVDVRGSGSVTTQPTGIGRISVPVNAWATIEATKDDYDATEESVFVREEDVEVELSIQRTPSISVELLSERVVIGERVSLSVTDEYGDPVSEATVLLDDESVAETDGSGQAVVEVPSAGNHTVVVEKGSLSTDDHTVIGVGEDGTAPTTEETEPAEDTSETEATQPGFGVLVALLALVVAVGAGLYRRDE